MKAKQTLVTTGIVVGTLAVIGSFVMSGELNLGADAISYRDEVDVQFTFGPTLGISLSSDAVSIANLAPGNSATSVSSGTSALTITTTTNNVAGYTLSATVGGTGAGAFESTSLMNGTATLASIAYVANPASYVTSLPTNGGGVWGYSTDLGSHFNGFANTTDAVVLKSTSAPTGTVSGDNTATFDIGAYAPAGQLAGEYTNVINFTSVSNVVTHTIATTSGTNGATATITAVDGSALSPAVTSGTYAEGAVLAISGTCDSGYELSGWARSGLFGSITESAGVYTYTVGRDDVTLTTVCEVAE